jgi:L-lactate dehydrogenase
MALVRIVGTILQDQRSVLPVSTLLDGEYGLRDVCLGIPSVVGQEGVQEIVTAPLTAEEQKAMQNSAAALQKALEQIKD